MLTFLNTLRVNSEIQAPKQMKCSKFHPGEPKTLGTTLQKQMLRQIGAKDLYTPDMYNIETSSYNLREKNTLPLAKSKKFVAFREIFYVCFETQAINSETLWSKQETEKFLVHGDKRHRHFLSRPAGNLLMRWSPNFAWI